jgi:hypothetical protein
MHRVALPDGRFFDADKAQCFEEGTRFDGNNHVSLATGSQWDHEKLYLTAGGVWVVVPSSQREGRNPEPTIIDADEAARWIVRNEQDVPEALAKWCKGLEV